jgi:hypothetical protein
MMGSRTEKAGKERDAVNRGEARQEPWKTALHVISEVWHGLSYGWSGEKGPSTITRAWKAKAQNFLRDF